MVKRCFDVIFSIIGLTLSAPFLFIIAIIIKIDSKGSIFFTQKRVGKNNIDFNILKFRTMHPQTTTNSLLTIGNKDSRITKIGYFLRRYKIDELPQLINVLKGEMSFVGPRPELRHYVNFYSKEDLVILTIKPGITGLASLKYRNEVELLEKASNPEHFYINTIIPDKLKYNKEYLSKKSLLLDLKIIIKTLLKL